MSSVTPLYIRLGRKISYDKKTKCWNFTGHRDKDGYGRIRPDGARSGEKVWAHRASYELYVGKIPEGHEIDHLCRNPSCCNPDHLDAVPKSVNLNRARVKDDRTHCKKGHELNIDNLYMNPKTGHFECRECKALRARNYRRRHKK